MLLDSVSVQESLPSFSLEMHVSPTLSPKKNHLRHQENGGSAKIVWEFKLNNKHQDIFGKNESTDIREEQENSTLIVGHRLRPTFLGTTPGRAQMRRFQPLISQPGL